MRVPALTLVVVLSSLGGAFALAPDPASCDKCTCVWPWASECRPCCEAKLLNLATTTQMQRIFSLDAGTAKKVESARSRGPLTNVDELKGVLTDTELKSVKKGIGSVTKAQSKEILSPSATTKSSAAAAKKSSDPD